MASYTIPYHRGGGGGGTSYQNQAHDRSLNVVLALEYTKLQPAGGSVWV
jgi:hypothetical protein